jgi:sec-independent protein translocase protein TatC
MSTEAATMPATDEGRMSLMEHLVELRKRLFKCILAVLIGALVGWFLYNPVLHILLGPLQQISHNPKLHKGSSLDDVIYAINHQRSLANGKLVASGPLEAFFLRIKISAYIGIGLAMPVLMYQLWRFIAPGLYSNERKYAAWFVASATLLFAMGAFVAYITLPPALTFLQSVAGSSWVSGYSGQNYLTLIVYMMLAFGGGFEFPIVLVFLQLVGVINSRQLRDVRRYALVGIFIIAAVVTPSSDPFSLFALAIPMLIFYEFSILFGRVRERRIRKRAAATP